MATSDVLAQLLAAVHAQARGVDWASWQVPPGDARLAEHLFADEPPEFSSTPDRKQISFHGNSFTRIADTANLRPA